MDKNKTVVDVTSRREFLEKAGKAAAVAPAVTLLLAAGRANAQAVPYEQTQTDVGNGNEDA